MKKTTITIYTDDDGFYGNSSSAEIDAIDHRTSYENYQMAVNTEVWKLYPAAVIEHEYQAHLTGIVCNDEEITANVEGIVEQIYNDGKFWAMK